MVRIVVVIEGQDQDGIQASARNSMVDVYLKCPCSPRYESCAGNPRVFPRVPVPLPAEARTRGFFLLGLQGLYLYPHPRKPLPLPGTQNRTRTHTHGSGFRVCEIFTRAGRGQTRSGYITRFTPPCLHARPPSSYFILRAYKTQIAQPGQSFMHLPLRRWITHRLN